MGVLSSLSKNFFPLFLEQTRVARYVVLPGSVFGVTAPSEADRVIGSQWAPFVDLPGIVPNAPAALFFSAKPESGNNPRFTVRISTSGGAHLLEHKFVDDAKHWWHLVIPSNALSESQNELIFDVREGDDGLGGTVTFADAFVLYTADKTTIKKPIDLVAQG